MSDNQTQPTPPPTPVAKTSSVPLKKETVRITLRARPGAGVTQPKESTSQVPSSGTSPLPSMGGAEGTSRVPPPAARTLSSPVTPLTAPVGVVRPGTTPVAAASKATSPIQLPSAPLPPPAVRPATSPVQIAPTQATLPPKPAPVSAPRPPAPSVAGGAPRPPGAPPAPGGARPPMPAATVPLAKSPAAPRPMAPPPGAKVETGASTVPLAQRPAVAKPGGTGTAPMAKAAGSPGGTTAQLPKATVKLQQTVGMAKAPQLPTQASAVVARPAEEAYEEKDPEAGLVPLAVLCTILAAALMTLNLFSNDVLKMWDESGSSSFLSPPPNDPKWEQRQPDGTYVNKFPDTLRDITRVVTP